MKIVELKLEDGITGEGITAISLVKHPAIEQNWIAFSKDGETVAKPNKEFAFKTIDADQRIVAGPAMIPEKLIYRKDPGPDGEEYFVFFTVDTIRELSERFLLQGKQNSMTLEHESTLNDLSVVESWIVEDPEKDKSAMYGFELPVGSWFVKVKVLNDDVWDLVKDDSVSGFSVEGVFTRDIIQNSKIEMSKETKLDMYLNKVKNLFTEDVLSVIPAVEVEPAAAVPDKFGTIEGEGANGSIEITFPGEVMEVGAEITTLVDEVATPVPTGEYVLTDGATLVVAEEGIVGEVKPAEEEAEEDMDKDGLKGEQIDALVDGIASILATFKTDVEKKIEEGHTKMAADLRVEFNKPAANVVVEIPEAESAKNKIVQGLSKFVKEAKS